MPEANIRSNAKQVAALEAETRKQSNSELWFTHRAGRITASKLRSSVCRTRFFIALCEFYH